MDDDCDGVVDDDASSSCPAVANGTAQCVAGTCLIASCAVGFDDCDSGYGNGCEASLATTSHCGGCGASCSSRPNATVTCGASGCEYTCVATTHLCGTDCVSDFEPSTCGTSCTPCPTPASSDAACDGTTCGFDCRPGWGDCNASAADGCEHTLDTLADCGACGRVCSAPNATESCSGDVCQVVTCDAGWFDCNGDASDGCESTITCPWVIRFGSVGGDGGRAVGLDAAGNTYVAGDFWATTANFGGADVTSAGGQDIFLASYTSAGGHRWSRAVGGASTDIPHDLAVDDAGNLYLAAQTRSVGNPDFGGGPLPGSGGMVIASYASDGTFRWANRYGAAGTAIPLAIAVDDANRVYVTGYFQGTIDFGGSSLPTAGYDDIFVASYAATTGAHRWSQAYGSSQDDAANGIGTDPTGNVVVGGVFQGNVDFGGGVIVSMIEDGFILGLTSEGAHRWSLRRGGSGVESISEVGVDDTGRAYVARAGSGVIEALSPAGASLWSAGCPSLGFGGVADIATRPGSRTYVTGWHGVCSFDSSGSRDLHLTYTDALARGISIDALGSLVVTGSFESTVSFGTIGSVTSIGGRDAYLLRLIDP